MVPAQIVCIIGPSIGYNKEVVMRRGFVNGSETWSLPSTEDAERDVGTLLHEWFGMTLMPKELLELGGARRADTRDAAPAAQLHVIQLSAERLDTLLKGAPGKCDVQIKTYREIISRQLQDFDWHTVGMCMFACAHNDR